MTSSITLPAPAKLNLFLHIVGRRPDGYHELQTLFQFLDHGDDITLTLTPERPGIRLTQALDDVPDQDNLVVRAAEAWRNVRTRPCPGSTSASPSACPWAAAWVVAALTLPLPCWA